MAVNIFGESQQHIHGAIGQKGVPGIGFKILDEEGNYDISNKRLANVAEAVDTSDAVNKEYVDSNIEIAEGGLRDYIDVRFDMCDTMLDTLRIGLSRDISNVTDICDIAADHSRREIGSVDERLIDLGSKVSNLSDTVGVMTTDVVINANEIEHIKVMVESLKEDNKSDESLSRALSVIGDKMSTLEISLDALEQKLSTLDKRVDGLLKARIRNTLAGVSNLTSLHPNSVMGA